MLFKEFGHSATKSKWNIGKEKQPQKRSYPAQQNKEVRANNLVKITCHEPEENAPLLPNSKIQLGDRARIMNPTRGQQSEGIVIGTTESEGYS